MISLLFFEPLIFGVTPSSSVNTNRVMLGVFLAAFAVNKGLWEGLICSAASSNILFSCVFSKSKYNRFGDGI